MSDDLVKRLQGWARDIQVGSTTIWAMDQDLKEAADSIEELEKTLALRTCEADAKALIVSGLEAKLKAITERNDLVEYANVELGEKLAKAVEALRLYIYETTHLSAEEDDGSHWCKISKDCLTRARATLAELKGESHE